MLTLTDTAATEIRTLTANPEIPESSGLRIAASPEGDNLLLSLAAGPADGDAVVENEGARVFLEPTAAVMLDGQALDAGVDAEGKTRFSVTPQTGP